MKTSSSPRELTLAQKEALQKAKQERSATIRQVLNRNALTRNNSLGLNTPPSSPTTGTISLYPRNLSWKARKASTSLRSDAQSALRSIFHFAYFLVNLVTGQSFRNGRQKLLFFHSFKLALLKIVNRRRLEYPTRLTRFFEQAGEPAGDSGRRRDQAVDVLFARRANTTEVHCG